MRLARTASLLLAASALACGGSAPEPPNVLLVTLDTLRADALSCYGGDPRTSPAIDALAAQGVLFERAYSDTNVTKPAHVTILTGQRLIEHRVFNNQVLAPPDLRTVPELLRRRGWRTAAFVGAIQLGEASGIPGFELVDGPKSASRDGADVVAGAVKWLQQPAREPFFLWVHLFDAHTLYTPPDGLARRFYEGDPKAGDGPLLSEQPFVSTWDYPPMQRWIEGVRDPAWGPAMYAAEVAYTDGLVGRLLAGLDASGLAPRTGVVLVADHGESLGEHGVLYDHAGLYDVSLKIPLVVRWPGIAGGRRLAPLVTQLDLAPTLADLLELPLSAGAQGRSLRPLLEGRADAPEEPPAFVFESAHNHHVAVRRGRWKAIWPVFERHRFFSAVPELYDLDADPGETANVAAEHPDVMEELARYAAPWRALGVIEKGDLPEVGEEIQRELSGLGYASGPAPGAAAAPGSARDAAEKPR